MSLRAFRALLSLAKAETETRARVLADAERAVAAAKAHIETHDAGVQRERAAAQADGDSLMAYGAFFKRAQAQRQTLALRLGAAETYADFARNAVTAAMVEQKKLENVVEQAEDREEEKREAAVRAQLDEAATLRYARPSQPR